MSISHKTPLKRTLHKVVVAHYNDVFYHKTETFIYNYASYLKSFYPIYFAREFINLDLFPIKKKDTYCVPVAPLKRYSWRWFYYSVLRRLLGIFICREEIVLRKRKTRLIHAHFAPQGYFALKLRGKLKIPIVTNFYGYDISKLPKNSEWFRRYQILFNEGNLFLVEGEFMKSRLIELGCPENKIKIQRIALPLDKIPFFPRQPKKTKEKAILIFAGRLIEKKGLIYALQAIKVVRNRCADFEFRIIGDGALRPQIEAFIQELQLFQYVKLFGFLNYREYLEEMRKADIFLHPSVTAQDGDSEGGAPTTILEAQASGMPIISTTHADIPNIVLAGKSALLSPEKDVEGLAKNIIYLLDNRQAWETMGRAGREFVEQYHNINKEIDALEEKYWSVMRN